MNKSIMFLCLFMFSIFTSSQANYTGRKVYIVFMRDLPPNMDYPTILKRHYSLLRRVTGKSYKPSLMRFNYGKIFDGFSAWLTVEESKKLAAMPEVASIFPNKGLHIQKSVHVLTDEVIASGLRTQGLAPL